MTKAEVVKEVSKSTGIEANTVMAVVEGFMEAVKGSLAKENNVYLRGFGTFEVKTPRRKGPAFKPWEDFKKMVK